MKYDEYDLWVSENAYGRVREVLELMEEYGGARAIYESSRFPKWKREINRFSGAMEAAEKNGIGICGIYDEDYPDMLRYIDDPPYILYYKGRLPVENKGMCSVVGSRKATGYGRTMAYDIGKILGSHGVTVVSGMALGADACAHRGCIDGGGITAAVLGSGADLCTPLSNLKLRDKIIDSGGCIISEFTPGTPGYAANYPRRNRIISGMSESLIVVEADNKSGTSITANLALEQGRDVYALPGNINSVMSRGTNRLIKEGAVPLISLEDLLEEIVPDQPENRKCMRELSDDEYDVIEYVSSRGSVSVNELCENFVKTVNDISVILTVLEMKGCILNENGKIIIAK